MAVGNKSKMKVTVLLSIIFTSSLLLAGKGICCFVARYRHQTEFDEQVSVAVTATEAVVAVMEEAVVAGEEVVVMTDFTEEV